MADKGKKKRGKTRKGSARRRSSKGERVRKSRGLATRRDRRGGGPITCGRCHPPVDPDSVKWLDEEVQGP